jgi:biopolymer transport protein TolR
MPATAPRGKTRRKPMAEINVVPYIDVMLVLLVIFMVTAPLLYQGAEINLPQASADPLPQENIEPVIVEIDGKLYETVIIGSDTKSPPSSVLQRRYPVYRSHQIDG